MRLCYLSAMHESDWERRLLAEIEKRVEATKHLPRGRGRISHREMSKAIKRGDGYINAFVNEGKEPSLDSVIRLAEYLGVSLSYILWGLEISPQDEELLRRLAKLPDEAKEDFARFLRRLPQGEQAPQ